jgi:hypothetical protein
MKVKKLIKELKKIKKENGNMQVYFSTYGNIIFSVDLVDKQIMYDEHIVIGPREKYILLRSMD